MPEAEASTYRIHPFDLTKVWPHADYPLIEVGVMELNRNPENFFAEVEQAAFAPANVIPGIGFSPDKMLQGRLFSYGDAQRYRLGVNYPQIPVNAPKCPFHSYHRDGLGRVDGNSGRAPGYEPNRHQEWADQPEYADPPLPICGEGAHWNFRRDDDDYYSQPRALYQLLKADERTRLHENTARAFADATAEVQQRHIENCRKADPEYGRGVESALAALRLGRP
jgi:catalase